MDFVTKSTHPSEQSTDCLITAVFANQTLSTAGEALDQASEGYLSQVLKQGDITGKSGEVLLLPHVPNAKAKRVLLVGAGKAESLTPKKFLSIVNSAISSLLNTASKNAVITLAEDLIVGDHDNYWKARQIIQAIGQQHYSFDQFKTDKKALKKYALTKVTFCHSEKDEQQNLKKACHHGKALISGIYKAKDLGNLPANVCTPRYLAKEAKALEKDFNNVKATVLTEKEIKALNMGAFLSVTAGTEEPPRLIVVEYNGGKKSQAPYVLVGKGITFDSGGISLKPAANMDEMKYDMCGAASVMGTLRTIVELQSPINVIGIIVAAENLPSGKATKPGDIVTSMSGQTIEILNTDAEGRLVLCDALTYAERYKPAAVIDIATLTGACVVALGAHTSALCSNNDELANQLLNASQSAYDRAWQLPLWEDYQEQLDSPFADMANIGGPKAGTITAACFLSRFTKSYPWAHLDIAGVAWTGGEKKNASGRPVPLLTQYLIDQAN
ncbi:leucyl aminopeptidase [Zooshikella sp. RANM57]|uniref:leucyl aminopeptidase n=1 Tax=Zooshikella sp. RANM57 TaxID=3425863 RepID=UPI003D6FB78D